MYINIYIYAKQLILSFIYQSCVSNRKSTKSKKSNDKSSDGNSTAKSDSKPSKSKGGEKVKLEDFLAEAATPTGVTPFDEALRQAAPHQNEE